MSQAGHPPAAASPLPAQLRIWLREKFIREMMLTKTQAVALRGAACSQACSRPATSSAAARFSYGRTHPNRRPAFSPVHSFVIPTGAHGRMRSLGSELSTIAHACMHAPAIARNAFRLPLPRSGIRSGIVTAGGATASSVQRSVAKGKHCLCATHKHAHGYIFMHPSINTEL